MDKIYTKQKPVILVSATMVGLAFVAAFSGGLPLAKLGTQKAQATVGSKTIQVEVVSTAEDQAKGLSGRKSLDENSGMLFDFGDYQARTFWMRDMNFPLDIIWISGGKIVGVDKNALPEGEAPQKKYHSPGPVDRVLEMNAGWFERNGVMVGQAFSLVEIDKNP